MIVILEDSIILFISEEVIFVFIYNANNPLWYYTIQYININVLKQDRTKCY